MKIEDVMLDLETLGTAPGCVVLSIGACAFNEDGPQRSMYAVLSTPAQKKLGLLEDPDTAIWWSKQSDKAKEVLLESEKRKSSPIHELVLFNQFLANLGTSKVRVWGNGADFDNPILLAVYRAVKLKHGWGPYSNRCYRTLKSFAPDMKMNRAGTHHNALDDATSQAMHATQVLSALGLWSKL